jgi:hypothetical protein
MTVRLVLATQVVTVEPRVVGRRGPGLVASRAT